MPNNPNKTNQNTPPQNTPPQNTPPQNTPPQNTPPVPSGHIYTGPKTVEEYYQATAEIINRYQLTTKPVPDSEIKLREAQLLSNLKANSGISLESMDPNSREAINNSRTDIRRWKFVNSLIDKSLGVFESYFDFIAHDIPDKDLRYYQIRDMQLETAKNLELSVTALVTALEGNLNFTPVYGKNRSIHQTGDTTNVYYAPFSHDGKNYSVKMSFRPRSFTELTGAQSEEDSGEARIKFDIFDVNKDPVTGNDTIIEIPNRVKFRWDLSRNMRVTELPLGIFLDLETPLISRDYKIYALPPKCVQSAGPNEVNGHHFGVNFLDLNESGSGLLGRYVDDFEQVVIRLERLITKSACQR